MRKILFFVMAFVLAMPEYASGIGGGVDAAVAKKDTMSVAGYEQELAELRKQQKVINSKINALNREWYRGEQEVSIHWGAPQLFTAFFMAPGTLVGDEWSRDVFSKPLYKTPMISIGNFTAAYHYRFNGFFWIGATLNYGCFTESVRYQDTKKIYYSGAYHFMRASVDCRFMYFDRRYVQMYSSVGLGFNAWIEESPYMVDGKVGKRFECLFVPFVLDATLFGVSFGDNVYGMAEIGLGRSMLNIGLGYRF